MGTELAKISPMQITPLQNGDAPEDLSPQQATALEGLLAGKTVVEAAATAGVGRTTIYKWLGNDFAFQAALNRGRRELQHAVSLRMDQLAADATECVAQAVRQGDVKAAMEILRRLNVLSPSKIDSDEELVLRMEQQKPLEDRAEVLALLGLHHQALPAKPK